MATTDEEQASITTDEMLREEANAIHSKEKVDEARPPAAKGDGRDFYRNLLSLNAAALCISGGGIRSASFSQGVIAALACHPPPQRTEGSEWTREAAGKSLLAQFHYLSTVSGGGYVGGWLSAWLARAHAAGTGWPSVWKALTGRRDDPNKEPDQIAWLRTYSNYLTPKIGLTSADTWAAIAIFLRNLILNWFVLLPVLIGVLIFMKLVAIMAYWFSREDHLDAKKIIFWVLVAFGLIGVWAALYFSNQQRPSHRPESKETKDKAAKPATQTETRVAQKGGSNENPPANQQKAADPQKETAQKPSAQAEFFKRDLFPGCAAALLLTLAIALPEAKELAKSYLVGPGRPAFRGLIGLAFLGVIITALSWTLAWPKRKGLAADLCSWVISGLIFGALVAVGIYFYFSVPETRTWPFPAKEVLLLTFGVPWGIMSGLIAEMIFVGLTKDMAGSDTDREWLGRAAGWYLLVAIAWPIILVLVFVGSVIAGKFYVELSTWIAAGGSGTITALLGKSGLTPAKSEGGKTLPLNVVLAVAAIIFAVALVVGLSSLLDHILYGEPLIATVKDKAIGPLWGFIPAAIALAVVGFVGWVAAWRVNINRFSLHALYRNRIIRGFLGASNLTRETTFDRFTNFDEKDNLRVHDLWPRNGSVRAENWRPFHVINMALNLAATENLAWQERKAESFTVSPLHSGCRLGYRNSDKYGDGDGISLGTAVAISGAAASPNMGYHSSPALAFLLTLFNVRLGWWLGNPGHAGDRTCKESSPLNAMKPLFSELFGQTTDSSDYVYLSDGGHFENLALYEMVRRRCRFIVAIDAGADKEFAFEDLGNAVRKIWIDFGIPITFENLKALKFREEKGTEYKTNEPPFYAVGIIRYPEAESPEQYGVILYVKPSFLGTRITNAGVRNYATANLDFPHQSTGDQWFSESQLESYRALGFEMMDSILTDIAAKSKPNPSLADIFAGLAAKSAAPFAEAAWFEGAFV